MLTRLLVRIAAVVGVIPAVARCGRFGTCLLPNRVWCIYGVDLRGVAKPPEAASHCSKGFSCRSVCPLLSPAP